MAERKVLNKYFPPDFDPAKVPRRKVAKDKQEVIRLMAPFSMRCNTCGDYIYAGKKFNGRKETVQGENYYGIKIFRFYIKCPTCSSEITFKTDPRNADYTVEHGVSRNFEPWREKKTEEEEAAAATDDPLAHLLEEEGIEASDDEDPMKALERRTEESKREMEVMDALQDIRTRNARMDRVNVDDVLQNHLDKGKTKLTAEEEERMRQEEDDEVLVKKYFGRDLADTEATQTRQSSDRTSGEASDSPDTPPDQIATLPTPSIAPAIKRARADSDLADQHLTSLLSENARATLLTTAAPLKAATTSSKKRAKGPNAFGIVRKKA